MRVTSAKLFNAAHQREACCLYSTQAGYERNIVESKYGPVDIPKMCLTDYIFKGHELVADKPAVVSTLYIISLDGAKVGDAWRQLRIRVALSSFHWTAKNGLLSGG